jgi:hypothetical protein
MSATHRPYFRQFSNGATPGTRSGPPRRARPIHRPRSGSTGLLAGTWAKIPHRHDGKCGQSNSQKAAHLQGRLTSPFRQAMR